MADDESVPAIGSTNRRGFRGKRKRKKGPHIGYVPKNPRKKMDTPEEEKVGVLLSPPTEEGASMVSMAMASPNSRIKVMKATNLF
jgi:hypothetical protein